MLVTIVSVANADNTGIDVDRVEKVEDIDPEVARKMLEFGSARLPSDHEMDAYRKARKFDADGELPPGETKGRNDTESAEPDKPSLTFTPQFKTTPGKTVKQTADPAPETTTGTSA